MTPEFLEKMRRLSDATVLVGTDLPPAVNHVLQFLAVECEVKESMEVLAPIPLIAERLDISQSTAAHGIRYLKKLDLIDKGAHARKMGTNVVVKLEALEEMADRIRARSPSFVSLLESCGAIRARPVPLSVRKRTRAYAAAVAAGTL